jgi:hypothetical protein
MWLMGIRLIVFTVPACVQILLESEPSTTTINVTQSPPPFPVLPLRFTLLSFVSADRKSKAICPWPHSTSRLSHSNTQSAAYSSKRNTAKSQNNTRRFGIDRQGCFKRRSRYHNQITAGSQSRTPDLALAAAETGNPSANYNLSRLSPLKT